MYEWIDTVVSGLADKGWVSLERVLSTSFCTELNSWINHQVQSGSFQRAGIGKGQRHQQDDAVRGDQILWLPDHGHDAELSDLEALLGALKQRLNCELYAGLEAFEGHFAIYAPGAFYKQHLDAFRDDDARKITLIIYLNESWDSQAGGELVLEMNDRSTVTIAPRMGTLVMFDSRRFPHEVLAANKERRSFTGWFKVRPLR